MIKHYAVNNKKLEYLEKTIKLIDIAGTIDIELKGDEVKEIIKVIDNNTLIAIAMLIAQSNPKEKDISIDLVMNFKKMINDIKE